MAIIYSYPEIPDVQGGDLLLISDTGAPNKPTRSVDIDDLAAYIGTVIGIGFWNLGTAPDSIFTTKMASIGQNANIASSKLNVYKTDDMTASVPHIATFNESSSNHSLNLWPSPGNNQADIYGSVSRGTFTGSGTVDQIVGSNPIGRHSGSGSVNFIQGVQASASLTGSGSTKTMVASYNNAFIEGTGSNNIESAIGAWNVVELNGLNDVDNIFGTYSNIVLTNGEVNDDAIGHYINFQQVAADTDINNAYYIHAKNDSLSVTGEKFFIKDETGIPSQFSNKLVLNAYGSGAFTGTATQRLAVDTNGNVIEIPIGSGPVDGSGTANYTARWIDTDTLGIGALYDNGNYVGIGTNNPTNKLHVYNGITRLDSGSASSNALGVYSNFSNTAINLFANSGSGFISVNSSGMDLGAPWNGGAKVSILNNGNFGIGTTSPAAKLHLSESASGGNPSFILQDNARSGAAALNYILLTDSLNTNQAKIGYLSGLNTDLTLQNLVGNTSLVSSGQTKIISGTNTLFENSGSERMRINSSGNVGIGTTNPTANLQLGAFGTADQEFRIESSGNSYFSVLTTNGVQKIYAGGAGTQSNEMAFYTSNSGAEGEAMRITSTGNVGIGTNSPASIMEINGGSGNGVKITAANAGTEFVLNASTSNGTSRLWVGGNGNVGIGTTSPSEKLHVTGYAKADTGFKAGNYTILNESGNETSLSNTAYYPMFFKTNNSTRMTISNAGNVGIGTTSPGTKLHVSGGIITVNDGTGITYYEGNKINSYNVSGYTIIGRDGLTLSTASADKDIILSPTGNVGIGTTSPGAKLSVNGNVKIEGTNSLLFGGSASIPSWAINHNGSDLLIDDQGGNIGSVLFNNSEGVALPRLTTTQISAISLPAQGLMAYNTTLNTICFYNGSSWQKVSHANM